MTIFALHFEIPFNQIVMARICEITGKIAIKGHKVSHSNKKSKRWFSPNIQTKTFFVQEENRDIKLRVSAEGLRHIILVRQALFHQTHHRMGLPHTVPQRILRQHDP